MTEKIDPELVHDEDDKTVSDTVEPVVLPEYDPEDFELPEDYEYEEEGEENGSEE